MTDIAIIGAGAWGTALSMVAARKGGHRVRLWAFEEDVCESIRTRRVNEKFLPGLPVPEGVDVTRDLGEAVAGAEMVVSVMPSHHCRAVFRGLAPHLRRDMMFVSATKGIEEESFLRMTEVVAATIESMKGFRPRIAALSGPSFAREVARGDPTAITVASQNEEVAQAAQITLSDPRLRIYTNDDMIGVELGGSLKNVIAIAAGVCDGLGLGHNSVAALITRGLAEMTRLVLACGGRSETMAGLAGLGDLVLTCTGGLSRNRSVGEQLGKGEKLADIIAGMRGMVAEGVPTTNAAVGLAQRHKVEMPITEKMWEVLHEGKPPAEAMHELMTRSVKSESGVRA
jgi:glycerol-3-phosphate dehydrogenase (NAD(P)+)